MHYFKKHKWHEDKKLLNAKQFNFFVDIEAVHEDIRREKFKFLKFTLPSV